MYHANKIKEISIEILKLDNSRENRDRIARLKESQLGLIFNVLEQKNQLFIELWNRNLDLLEGEKIQFKVVEVGEEYFKSFTKMLFGHISKMGELNFKSKKGGMEFPKFQERRYPIQYKGQIDAIGRSEISIKKKRFNLTGLTYPVSYVGSITKNGEIKMELEKTRIKFFGTQSILKMQCRPFFGTPEKRDEFIKNREEMLGLASEFLLELESE